MKCDKTNKDYLVLSTNLSSSQHDASSINKIIRHSGTIKHWFSSLGSYISGSRFLDCFDMILRRHLFVM